MVAVDFISLASIGWVLTNSVEEGFLLVHGTSCEQPLCTQNLCTIFLRRGSLVIIFSQLRKLVLWGPNC